MSIEKRIVPLSRSFRTLIKNTRRIAKQIKDLKDLKALQGIKCYRHSGPKGPEETFFPQRERWRGTGPRPTMKGGFSPTVARGPVPRDRYRHDAVLGPLGP